MIVLLNVRQPQERSIPRCELGEFLAHAVVPLGSGIHPRLAAQASQPRRLAFGASPAIGHQVPCDPEDVTAQLFIVESPDISPNQATERVLHDIVRVACVTGDAVDVRPQRACRPLVEPRKLDLGQRSTYAERAVSCEAGWCDVPLMSPILRDSLSDT
jgi:hypothetical protein